MESIADKVLKTVEPAIEAEGYTLVDMELGREGGQCILRIFIDKAEGGITHEDCERVSTLVSPMLDVENVIEERYFLEVSSPGINRRIKKKADFERFAGMKVKIFLRSPVDGHKKVTGIIESVESDEVVIRNEKAGSENVKRVPLAAIGRANLQIL
ncbi:ribosome maturation factor RimP [Candidatus Poribacteria bacterium]|nr:ribosome maturation factor RimP [Candidatus Poribacteria bacterium]